MAELPWNF